MRPLAAIVLSAFATAACGGERWALTDVAIVDVEAGAVIANAAIVVQSDRIVAAGSRDAVDIPWGASRIDGAGGFAIPGLWDMHVHLRDAGESALPLMVANGVTGVRDMGGDLSVVDRLRQAVRAGGVLGPRIVRSGRPVDGQKALTDRYILETPEEGRAAVAELVDAGADHIKVHNGLPREVFFAVADEAQRRGIPLVGHVPLEVHPAEAIGDGLKTVEHVATIYEGTLSANVRTPADQLRLVSEYPRHGADTLAAHFAAHQAWFTPTLVAYAVNSRLAELEETPDPRRRYLSPGLVDHWDRAFPVEPFELDPRLIALRRQGDTAFAALVTTFHAGGVGLLLGTDLGTREIYPGFSVHDELALLVERAGLAPLQALRTATSNPARYLDATDSLGAVAAGRVADFVLLDANPLENIRHTSRIRAVVRGGRYLDRDALDDILTAAERLAAATVEPSGGD